MQGDTPLAFLHNIQDLIEKMHQAQARDVNMCTRANYYLRLQDVLQLQNVIHVHLFSLFYYCLYLFYCCLYSTGYTAGPTSMSVFFFLAIKKQLGF